MKFIITENQLSHFENHTQKLEKLKNLFFKFWDRSGPKIDDDTLKFFGFDRGLTKIGDTPINVHNLRRFLREWHGENKAMLIALKMLDGQTFSIGQDYKCGGYDFDFKITSVIGNEEFGQIDVSVQVDTKNGSVELIMVGGEIENLNDAINNEEYGWEIKGEISDCILDILTDKVTNTTGYEIVVEHLKFGY